MKRMFSICVTTLALISVAQANIVPKEAQPLSIEGPLGRAGLSEPEYNPRIYDIWCSAKGDDCFLTTTTGGRKLSKSRLKAHIPMADQTTDCSLEFCYNASGDVIGLNPEYPLWSKSKQ